MTRPLLFLIAVLAAVPACGDDSKSDDAEAVDVAAVEATLRAARDDLSTGDVAGFMESWTDNGLQQVFHEAGEAFIANSGYYVGARQYVLGASSAPVVVGDTATAVAPLFFRLLGVVREFTLIKVDGAWKIDSAAMTTTDVDNAIDIAFGESSIGFDSSAITEDTAALQVRNPTTRRHELNVLTAPPELDIAAFFEHPEDAPPVPEGMSMPEGFDFVGGVVDIEPGMTLTVLFSQSLPPARYAMFCNSEDGATAEPHSKRGEFLEFT
ncbi:MAG TPA: hypothetical protein VH761_09895, partial [Ilumatobacteraceae bacterium]